MILIALFFGGLELRGLNRFPQLIESLKLLHYHGRIRRTQKLSACHAPEEKRQCLRTPFPKDELPRIYFLNPTAFALAKRSAAKLRARKILWIIILYLGDRRKLTAAYSAVRQSNPDACALILDFPRADKCDDSNWRICLESFADSNGDCKMIAIATLPECLPEDIIKFAADKGIAALAGLPEAIAAMEAAADIGESQRSQFPRRFSPLRKSIRTAKELPMNLNQSKF